MPNIEAITSRRIKFLLEEAAGPDPQYDHAIRFTMRSLTNYLNFGADMQSGKIKRFCKTWSWLKLKECDCEWEAKTTNEHQEPLAVVWKWILENAASLTIQDVVIRLKKYPLAIITKDENAMLRDVDRLHKNITPEDRYNKAKIELMAIPF
jgi:hypothetical protein